MKTVHSFSELLLGVFIILVVLFDWSENFPPFANYVFPLVVIVSLPRLSRIKWTFAHLAVFAFALWSFISLLWTVDPEPSKIRALTVLLMVLLFYCITSYGKSGDKAYNIFVYYFFVATTILLFMAFFALKAYSLDVLRTSERLETGLMDDNGFGKYLSFGSIICLFYALTKRKYKLLYIFLYIFYLYMGVVLKSKSTLLAMLLGAILLMYIYYKDRNQRKKFVLVVSGVVALFVIIFQSGFFGDAFIRVTHMFEFAGGNDEADGSTFERLALIHQGWNDFLDSPFFGNGIGSCGKFTGGTYYHNNYVQLLAETGIVGFIFYYGMVLWLIIRIWKYKFEYDGALFLVFILIMLIGDTNNTTYYHKMTYLLYGMCILFLQSKKIGDIKYKLINKQI